jgi:hypothetical protein
LIQQLEQLYQQVSMYKDQQSDEIKKQITKRKQIIAKQQKNITKQLNIKSMSLEQLGSSGVAFITFKN